VIIAILVGTSWNIWLCELPLKPGMLPAKQSTGRHRLMEQRRNDDEDPNLESQNCLCRSDFSGRRVSRSYRRKPRMERSAMQDQIDEYHGFMTDHPTASTQIRENPQLVYDNKFLKSHPEVERFLKRHPELRQEIARRPGQVFGSYRNDYRYGGYHRDDRRFDWWHH
jgi:hypothetical protein